MFFLLKKNVNGTRDPALPSWQIALKMSIFWNTSLTNNIYTTQTNISVINYGKITLPNVWVPEHNMFCVDTLRGLWELWDLDFVLYLCLRLCFVFCAMSNPEHNVFCVHTHGGALSRWDPPHTWYWPAGLLWKEANTYTATALIVIKTPSLW